VLHATGTFYSKAFSPDALYTKNLFHQKTFTPHTFLKILEAFYPANSFPLDPEAFYTRNSTVTCFLYLESQVFHLNKDEKIDTLWEKKTKLH